MRVAFAIVAAVVGTAHADPTASNQVEDRLQGLLWRDTSSDEKAKKIAHPSPRVVLDDAGPRTDLKEDSGIGSSMFALARPTPVLVAVAIDEKAAWVSANLGAPFPPPEKQDIDGHVLAVFDAPAPWQPVMTHVGMQRTAYVVGKTDGTPPKMIDRVEAGAGAAVKRFKATIGDPAALAKSVSDRVDDTLFGSEPNERYTGGENVRAQLRAWKLAFTVRDGIAAGIAANKTVAWVAAYVDARKVGQPKSAATVYLMSAIYELHGKSWDVVALQFSNPTAK